jgi:DNA-binding MarR family transcriptional regulator
MSRRKKSQQVAEALHSASIHLLRALRTSDKTSGISPARLSALSVLVFGGPTSLGGLAITEQVSAPTMSRLIDALKQDGLVFKKPAHNDRRRVMIAASAKGKRLMEQARFRRTQRLATEIDQLGATEFRALEQAAKPLQKLTAKLRNQNG